jgi:YaiO family outer membrane protein
MGGDAEKGISRAGRGWRVRAPWGVSAWNARWAGVGLAALFVALAPIDVRAQERWFGGLYFDHDSFGESVPAWESWQSVRASIVREVDGGAIGLEVERVERFGRSDLAAAADLYVNLWPGSYANLRARYAPDPEVLPAADWRLEVFQSLPGAWEASANARLSTVPGPNVTVLGLGIAKYVSAWYLRGLGTVAEVDGTRSGGGAFFARRFFADDGRQFVEAGGGLGGESVAVGPGPTLDVRDTAFFQISFQRTVRGPFGAHATVGAHDFEGLPLRSHVTLGVTARF